MPLPKAMQDYPIAQGRRKEGDRDNEALRHLSARPVIFLLLLLLLILLAMSVKLKVGKKTIGDTQQNPKPRSSDQPFSRLHTVFLFIFSSNRIQTKAAHLNPNPVSYHSVSFHFVGFLFPSAELQASSLTAHPPPSQMGGLFFFITFFFWVVFSSKVDRHNNNALSRAQSQDVVNRRDKTIAALSY